MSVISSTIDRHAETYLNNTDQMQVLVNQLQAKLQTVEQGGTYKAREKHQQKGKLLVRERIKYLLDPGSFFMELSALAADAVYDCDLPSAGIITGIGEVHGRKVMIIANDATVKGGTYFPLTVKKHLRAQQVADENNLPCIHLVDSGGAYLQMQDQVFPDHDCFGRIFYNQARMSAKGLSQIAVVMGPCVAGGAYVAAMSDETIIVKAQGTIYLGGPELVYAATGEEIDAETLGGGEMHCKISGVADHLVENDSEAIELCRQIISYCNQAEEKQHKILQYESPVYESYELYGIASVDLRQPVNAHEIIARLVDASDFHEFKALYGQTLVCGFAKIQGFKVGIVANQGILFSESALKGTHFINLCDQRKIPLVFLQNIAGFMVGKHYEQQGIAKDGAKMVTAVSTAQVPKFTVIIGGSFGAGNYAMCGRAYGARFLWMWPNARISVMGGEVAAKLMSQIRQNNASDSNEPEQEKSQEKLREKIRTQFETQSQPFYSSARLWDDGVIDPADTRRYLATGLALANQKTEKKQHTPIYRM